VLHVSLRPGIAKVVILIRSNVVKMAFSGIRGKLSKELCGSSNTKVGINCSVSDHESTWSLSDFQRDIKWMQERNERLFRLHETLRPHSHILFYEDLQQAPLERLLEIFAENARVSSYLRMRKREKFSEETNKEDKRTKYGSSQWLKRSSEDLEKHVKNFQELVSFLNFSALTTEKSDDRSRFSCLLGALLAKNSTRIEGPCNRCK